LIPVLLSVPLAKCRELGIPAKKQDQSGQFPVRIIPEMFGKSGVDVMITIFCDFSQFSAKKLAFFSKTNVMINFFQNLSLF
jgi:hypothetical protein